MFLFLFTDHFWHDFHIYKARGIVFLSASPRRKISQDKRRQGIGSQAVEILLREVIPKCARVTLEILAHNQIGREFWKAAGFQNYSGCFERFTADRDGFAH